MGHGCTDGEEEGERGEGKLGRGGGESRKWRVESRARVEGAGALRRRTRQHVKEHTPSGGVGGISSLHTSRGCCAKSAPGAQHLILLMGFSRWKTRKEFLKSGGIWVFGCCAFRRACAKDLRGRGGGGCREHWRRCGARVDDQWPGAGRDLTGLGGVVCSCRGSRPGKAASAVGTSAALRIGGRVRWVWCGPVLGGGP